MALLDASGRPMFGSAPVTEEVTEKPLYRIHPDVAAVVANILQVCLLSTQAPVFEPLDASRLISEIMLEPSDDDPTNQTLTVNKQWLSHFNTELYSAMEKMNEYFEQFGSEKPE